MQDYVFLNSYKSIAVFFNTTFMYHISYSTPLRREVAWDSKYENSVITRIDALAYTNFCL